MMILAWRRLTRRWQSNAAVLACLTLASAILVSLSSYTASVATQELQQSLEEASSPERTLLITGARHTFTEELFQQLQEVLGPALQDRLVIRHTSLVTDPQPAAGETGQKPVPGALEIYAFNELPERVRLIEGRLPAQVLLYQAQDSWRPPPIEAVIGVQAAQGTGYGVGDRLTASRSYHRLEIVGVVEAVNPGGDLWAGDLGAFAVQAGEQGLYLPLIIATESMQSHYPEQAIFLHTVSWRILLDHDRIRAEKVEELRSGLVNFQAQSATRRATTSTGLIQILAEYLSRLSRTRMALFLLTVQALFLVLYTLSILTSDIVDGSRAELATLSDQGASAWQITRIMALENLMLALPSGLVLGPMLAQVILTLWKKTQGEEMRSVLSGEAWLLSLAAVGFGWLALVLPLFFAARRQALGRQEQRDQAPTISLVQRSYLDLYLLAFSGVLYWQLNQSGSFAIQRLKNTQLADPLLLISPFLLLIALVLVLLRVLPFLLRLAAGLTQRLPGLLLPLGLFRLARDPRHPGRVVLLIGLTVGLAFFTQIFGDSVAESQQVMASTSGPVGEAGHQTDLDDRLQGQSTASALNSDALTKGVQSILRLNTVILIPFSVAAFFLIHHSQARERLREFGVLRAMGLSEQQSVALLMIEGAALLLLGLLVGSAVGLALSRIMIPYLSQALAESLAGAAVAQIIRGPALVQLLILLVVGYGAALLLLGLTLRCTVDGWARQVVEE